MVRFFAALFLAAFAPLAQAQSYPDHLIKMTHGFPPGGNVDVIARLMAQEMSKGLGQPIVVESKPGGVGIVAADLVAKANPDGYTLLLVPSAHAVTGAISKVIKYKPVDDFAWISTVSFYPFILCVRKDSRFTTLAELLAAARAAPGTITYGSSGAGAIQHMTAELLANATGVKFVHVPYRGEALSMTGLLSHDVDFVITTTTTAVDHVRNGEVRALGVTSRARWKDIPDVPTIEEAGVPGFEVISWSGLATTAGTPGPIVARLNDEVRRAIAVPEVKKLLEDFGGEPRATTPDEMRDLVARQLDTWSKLSREAGISID